MSRFKVATPRQSIIQLSSFMEEGGVELSLLHGAMQSEKQNFQAGFITVY